MPICRGGASRQNGKISKLSKLIEIIKDGIEFIELDDIKVVYMENYK